MWIIGYIRLVAVLSLAGILTTFLLLVFNVPELPEAIFRKLEWAAGLTFFAVVFTTGIRLAVWGRP